MTEEAGTPPARYGTGDMLWGRVSGHPWWPCMVAKGPDSPSHFRTIKRRQNTQVQYHVQYFGEENERGWIAEASLMPYEGRQAFEKLQEEKLNPGAGIPSKKDKQNFVISSRRQRAWSNAVVQAEEALQLGSEDRLALYTFAYPEISFVDQQTPKSSPKKRKRRSSSKSSNDLNSLSIDKTIPSNLSDSLYESEDTELNEGNYTDSNSEAMALAKAGVRSGRAIKHTSRFVKHVNDIMKKKTRTSKSLTPPSSQYMSLNSSIIQDISVDLKTERLESGPTFTRSITLASNPIRIPPPAMTNHDVHIKVEPIADPFVEAQMLQHLENQRMLYQKSQQEDWQRLPLQNQFFDDLPIIHIQPLDPHERQQDGDDHQPLKKRRKRTNFDNTLEEKSNMTNHDFGHKVIVISPLSNSKLEGSSILPIVVAPTNTCLTSSTIPSVNHLVPATWPVTSSVSSSSSVATSALTTSPIAKPFSKTCTVSTNTDIDMKWFDQFTAKMSRLETACQTLSPFEELNLDDDDDNEFNRPMEIDHHYSKKGNDNDCNSGKNVTTTNLSKDADIPSDIKNQDDATSKSQNINSKITDGHDNGTGNDVEDNSADDGSKDIVMETIDLDSIDDDEDCNLASREMSEEFPSKIDEKVHQDVKLTNTTNDVKVGDSVGCLEIADTVLLANDKDTTNEGNDFQQNNDIISGDDISSSKVEFQNGTCDDDNANDDNGDEEDEAGDNESTRYIIPVSSKAQPEVEIHPYYGVMLKASHGGSPVQSSTHTREVNNYSLVPPKRICRRCEGRGEGLISCSGPCKGVYHPSCINSSSSSSSSSSSPQDSITCMQCATGHRTCFKCKGQLDERSEDTTQCNVRLQDCGKFYHGWCLKEISPCGVCPRHMCMTCSMESGRMANVKQLSRGPLYSCIKCPRSFHFNPFCLPASCKVVDGLDIICSAHFGSEEFRKCIEFSCDWCAVCLEGDKCDGTPDIIQNHKKHRQQGRRPHEILVTCSSCPLSFHPSCCKMSPSVKSWSCKDCQSGRVVCYGDVVWARASNYRWWPGMVLSVMETEDYNLVGVSHGSGDVAVYFYGINLALWVPWYRLLKFEDGEHLSKEYAFKSLSNFYDIATSMASEIHNKRIEAKNTELSLDQKLLSKPAPYKHIKVNIPLGGVEIFKAPPFENPACQCAPDENGHFCGPDSDCINRLMLYECHPMVCQGQDNCLNQRFTKRQDANVKPLKTPEKGWGLFAQSPIVKGQFIGEYVGDLIDSKECKRRLEEAQLNNIKNFYMLTLEKNRIIDAGPKGNYTRFLNHCCDPNCETQKWTVCGDIRVGLFALKDVPAGAELNFNYNLDCFGNEKTKCECRTDICSGFLGVRPKAVAAAEMEHKDIKKENVAQQQSRKRGRKPKLIMPN